MEERRLRNTPNALLIGLPRFHERSVPGVDGVREVCLSLAERGGRIGLSFGRRVSRRPNEGGQAKRGSPVRGREVLVEGWREDLDRYQKGARAARWARRAPTASGGSSVGCGTPPVANPVPVTRTATIAVRAATPSGCAATGGWGATPPPARST